LLCLSASCTKEDEDDSGSSAEKSTAPAKRVARPTGFDSEVALSKTVRNPYLKEHWQPDAEPENEWTEEFKAARSAEDKIDVIQRKHSSGPEMLAPLIRLALRDPDERVRTEAVMMIRSFAGVSGLTAGAQPLVGRGGGVTGGRSGGSSAGGGHGSAGSTLPEETAGGGPETGPVADEAVDLVVGAVHDPDREVRLLAMEAALELGPQTQLNIFRQTIAVPMESIRKMTITELGRMRTKPAFEVLITGLQNPDSEFRGEVNEEIKLLVRRGFETFDEAQEWWVESAGSYADNMVHIGGRR
jgi:hypothetical protein